MSNFFRYPSIPHLTWLSSTPARDDKLMTPADRASLLAGEVIVEEKLDGANLGFSINSQGTLQVQNRGQYLIHPYAGQFARLDRWIIAHQDRLFDHLPDSLIVFGEWCAARHSLDYDFLPDWWLMFDVYDRQARQFWSTARRDALAKRLKVSVVPRIASGHRTLKQLIDLQSQSVSQYRAGKVEGLIVRRDTPEWLSARGKIVDPAFSQSIEAHWRSRIPEWNQLAT